MVGRLKNSGETPAFRSLKLRACLGFASATRCGVCALSRAKTSSSLSCLPSQRVLDTQTRVEAPERNSDPHQFPEVPNRKHPGGFGFPDAARSPAFGELPHRPSHNSLPRKRLSSITLLGQKPSTSRNSRWNYSSSRVCDSLRAVPAYATHQAVIVSYVILGTV